MKYVVDTDLKFDWKKLRANERNRVSQVWLARSDTNDEFTPYVVVDRRSYNEFEVFGWELVSLDERQEHFGVFESQFHAVERGATDMWLLKRVS